MVRPPERRFPSVVYSVGTEPDPRFTLANERTILAWVRTSLSLMAAGVGLEALPLDIPPGLQLAASILLVLLGLVAPVQAWVGWMRTERALRMGLPLPDVKLSLPITGGLVVVAVLLVIGLILG